MKERFNVGSTHKVIPNVIPQWMAGCEVEVVSWEDFKSGKLATNAQFRWSLDDIRNAIFGRFLDGKKAGKVCMFSAGDFQ